MKSDTSDHFNNRFGTELLDLLEQAPERKIILVGHSAGAIFACNLLRAWAKRNTNRKIDLFLMAPAVRDLLFAETLAEARESIGQFRMFCLSDERERADALMGKKMGFLYPSSLLYVVSGLFEDDNQEPHVDAPLLGMQRFRNWSGRSLGDGEDTSAAAVRAFLGSIEHPAIFAPTNDGPGRACNATSHGGLDNDPQTLASIRTFFT